MAGYGHSAFWRARQMPGHPGRGEGVFIFSTTVRKGWTGVYSGEMEGRWTSACWALMEAGRPDLAGAGLAATPPATWAA